MISKERLMSKLSYNAESGEFWWTDGKNISSIKMREPAGCINKNTGYRMITIDRKTYCAHRLVFVYTLGFLPDGSIDHINGDKSDNRFCNLRVVSHQENMKNKSIPKSNKSGFIGVKWVKRKSSWEATIGVEGKVIYLGSFKNKSDAVKSRLEAEKKYGFHKNHGMR